MPDPLSSHTVEIDLHATALIIQRAEDELRQLTAGYAPEVIRRSGRALIDLEAARARLASILQRVEAAQ